MKKPLTLLLLSMALLQGHVYAQVITTVAGNGSSGPTADGGDATNTSIAFPSGCAVDQNNNLYIADTYHHRIRKVDLSTGIITTVAGTGVAGYTGDFGPATSAKLSMPSGVAVDNSGTLYIVDQNHQYIRKISGGTITTIYVNGADSGSEGGIADQMATDATGNLYFCDLELYRVYKKQTNGSLVSIAGTGTSGFNGDGIPATSAQLTEPRAVALDNSNNVYISDGYRIRKINASTNIITTVAGNGTGGFSGDGAAATSAQLNVSYGLAADGSGNFYIADTYNKRIRKVNAAGIINTFAGSGATGSGGDGGPATAAQFSFYLKALALGPSGNLYVADENNHRIRAILSCIITLTPPSPDDQVLCQGSPATTLSVSATGTGTFTYQWYQMYGSAIAGETTTSYTPPTNVAGTRSYYARIAGSCGTISTPSSGYVQTRATTTITNPSSANVTINKYNDIPLTVSSNNANTTFQWYKNPTQSNVGGTLIPGATSSAYLPDTSVPGSTTYYYCVATLCGSATCQPSGAITVTASTYVTIPDANFRARLKLLYPGCFNASDEMNAECAAVLNATILNVSNLSISNLSGVRFFTKLATLDCSRNNLTWLPQMPASLKTVNVSYNNLYDLEGLPAGVTTLDCSVNSQSHGFRPEPIPSGLISFTCQSNRLSDFPTLPGTLETFDCAGNWLTSLPSLPSSLKNLYCSTNRLTSLGSLPSSLVNLRCEYNDIVNLPSTWPSTLVDVRCGNNDIVSISSVPAAVQIFDCSYNKITSFNATLPNSLTTLTTDNNSSLAGLPPLPTGLTELSCRNNSIKNLPALPSTLTRIDFWNNRLTGTLAALHEGLTYINIGVNSISSITSLPSTLTELHVYSNSLTGLPALPAGLKKLDCGRNLLSALPAMPTGLTLLFIHENLLDFSDIEAISPKPATFNGQTQRYTISPSTKTVPYGGTVVIDGTIGGSANVYKWNGGAPSNAVFTKTNVTFSDAGYYTCYVTSTAPGNAGITISNVPAVRVDIVKADPVVTFTSIDNGPINGTINLTVDKGGSTGAVTYQVENQTGSATVSGSTLTLTGAGTVKVKASVAADANYNSGTAEQIVTIRANQTINFPDIPNKTCGEGSFNVNATASSGLAVSYTSLTPSVVVVNGNLVTIVGAGDASIKASQAGNSNFNAAPDVTESFVVNRTPKPDASGPLTFCPGGSVSLTASAGSSYQWSNGLTSQSILVTAAGSYSVTVTANGCTSTSDAVNVSLYNNPPAPSITGSSVICATMPSLTSSSASSYYWSNGQTTQSIAATGSGNYWVRITDANGCSATSSNFTVTDNRPSITMEPVSTLSPCSDNIGATLTASPGSSYTWYKDDSPYSSARSLTVTDAGKYYVRVTNPAGCSSTTLQSNAFINHSSFEVGISSSASSSCPGTLVQLSATIGPGYSGGRTNVMVQYSYTWSTGEYTSSIDVYEPGTYWVTVTDHRAGCSATATYTITTSSGCTPPDPCGSTVARLPCEEQQAMSSNSRLAYYPNPADDQVTVELEEPAEADAPLIVYTISGKTAILDQFRKGESQKAISTKELPAGVYIIHARLADRQLVTRMIVLHNR